MKIHIVKSGESLYAIANKYGVSLDELIEMNPEIDNPDVVDVGMKVKVPGGPMKTGGPEKQADAGLLHEHVVKQGDSLWKLSKAWGVPLNDVIKANPQLKNPNALLTGEKVYIPLASGTSPEAMGAGMENMQPNLAAPEQTGGKINTAPAAGKVPTAPAAKVPTAPVEKAQTAPVVELPPMPAPAKQPPQVIMPIHIEYEKHIDLFQHYGVPAVEAHAMTQLPQLPKVPEAPQVLPQAAPQAHHHHHHPMPVHELPAVSPAAAYPYPCPPLPDCYGNVLPAAMMPCGDSLAGMPYGYPHAVSAYPGHAYMTMADSPAAANAAFPGAGMPGGYGMMPGGGMTGADMAGGGYGMTPGAGTAGGGYDMMPGGAAAGGYGTLPGGPAAGGYGTVPGAGTTGGYGMTDGYGAMPGAGTTGGYGSMPGIGMPGGYGTMSGGGQMGGFGTMQSTGMQPGMTGAGMPAAGGYGAYGGYGTGTPMTGPAPGMPGGPHGGYGGYGGYGTAPSMAIPMPGMPGAGGFGCGGYGMGHPGYGQPYGSSYAGGAAPYYAGPAREASGTSYEGLQHSHRDCNCHGKRDDGEQAASVSEAADIAAGGATAKAAIGRKAAGKPAVRQAVKKTFKTKRRGSLPWINH